MEASALPRPKPLARWPGVRLRAADDAELVHRVRRGDEAAFEAVYDRHHRGILSFCRHMLGSREEAEDAVQHTFIAAYRDLVDSDKRIQLKPWLYAIARNRCLSVLRARRQQVALDDVDPATEGLSSQVQRRQDLREMLADLAALPEDQRGALVLAEIGALSHDEIAVSLDVRKDKVKALIFQARESLANSREARDVDCREIQEQLAVLRGGSLRRTLLRRHVERCPACAAYKAEVQRQRAAMSALLPVVPTVTLKHSVLAAAFGGGGGGAAAAGSGAVGAAGATAGAGMGGAGAAGGGALATGANGLAVKALLVVAVGAGATGAGVVVTDKIGNDPPPAVAGDQPAQLAPPSAGGTARDRGVAPSDGSAAPVVASLRGRANDVAAQRAADRRVGASPSGAFDGSGGGSRRSGPGPLTPAAIGPATVGLEEDGDARGGNGERKGHEKPKRKTGGERKDKDKDAGREPAAAGGPSRGGAKHEGTAGTNPKRASAQPGAGTKRSAPPRAPRRAKAKTDKRAKPGVGAKGRKAPVAVPPVPARPPAPASPPGAERPGIGDVVDGVTGAVPGAGKGKKKVLPNKDKLGAKDAGRADRSTAPRTTGDGADDPGPTATTAGAADDAAAEGDGGMAGALGRSLTGAMLRLLRL